DLTGSVTDVGLALAAARLPVLATVLAGGGLAGRPPRPWLMVGAGLGGLSALRRPGGPPVSGSAGVLGVRAAVPLPGVAAGAGCSIRPRRACCRRSSRRTGCSRQTACGRWATERPASRRPRLRE